MSALVRKLDRVPTRPSIRPEREWSRLNCGCLVAGVDEAGRGPLAGPVVAAAVIFDLAARRPAGLGDSKQLTARQRERLFGQIQRQAVAWGLGMCHAAEIDAINILEATRLASLRAVRSLGTAPGALLTDALELPAAGLPVAALVKGDARSASIAAASILAKVTRDRIMDLWHAEFPEYGWDRNRGYPTEDHYAALAQHGPTTAHRMTFSGVGFFDEEPRRSLSFHTLAERVRSCLGHPGALETLRIEIEARRDAIPPPDLDELLRLLASRRFESEA